MNLFDFDRAFCVENLCGVDEAGRGPLAGPVVAAAVVLNYDEIDLILQVNDSKKLSEKKRQGLFEKIKLCCKDFAVGVVDVAYIEQHNILNATMFAMKIAVEKLKFAPELVLVDGNRLPRLEVAAKSIVKGDCKSACVAAASIIAKVTRDNIMQELDVKFPNYGFKKHKGYATAMHYENLNKFGPCEVHRPSFLKKSKNLTLQKFRGGVGEKIAYGWLKSNGFSVVLKNYYSRFGEIDLIATKNESIFFIEVKLRSFGCGYDPKEAVVVSKQKKIVRTAMVFLSKHKIKLQPRFGVIEIFRQADGNFRVNFLSDVFCVKNEFEVFDRF